MTTADTTRIQSYDVWQQIAPTWEQRQAHVEGAVARVREWIVEALAPQRGDTVLDLAAGVGETGFELAGLVGPRGRLISSDFSPAMLDTARRRGAELGIANVEYRVIDAEQIDLESDSVDRVVCRYGYMLMADPAAALSESRRVLRPGGRLALAVFGAPARNPFFALAVAALVQGGHIPPPDPRDPGPFSMASAERTTGLLEQAGFGEVRVEEVAAPCFRFGDVVDYLSFLADTAGPVAVALRRLSADERKQVEARLAEPLRPFAVDGGFELPGVTLAAVAS